LEAKARAHLGGCFECCKTTVRYHVEITQALAGGPLPDALATRIRARLCPAGAAILDEILGVLP
jgi:hypothetical protein